ncbi:MAG: rRNA maturation RNase YbeY [Atopobiaceae bacterium]|nr:rRNA maturation RNase YbeY [Atopobiaceae bacterium]
MGCEVDLTYEDDVACALSTDEVIGICERVLAEEGIQRHCLVSVSIVEEETMRGLNAQWRGKDAPTDVLSLECERPDDPDLADDEPCELGDIVLAPEYIRNQAEAYGTTWADETRLLLVHGMLHLLGYDHMEDEEAQAMEAREDGIVESIKTDAHLQGVEFTRHRREGLA